MITIYFFFFFFFFNDTATTEIYTLSLHDALPIFQHERMKSCASRQPRNNLVCTARTCRLSFRLRRRSCSSVGATDRKSTRLNSSHLGISYAVFCLKKKKKKNQIYNIIQIYLYDL